MNKLIAFGCLLASLFFMALADSYGSERYPVNNTVNHYTVVVEGKGTATAIASSQHNFDWSTDKWQGSFGLGGFSNKSAHSFGLAKKFDKVLINGSVSHEEADTGYGLGIGWRF